MTENRKDKRQTHLQKPTLTEKDRINHRMARRMSFLGKQTWPLDPATIIPSWRAHIKHGLLWSPEKIPDRNQRDLEKQVWMEMRYVESAYRELYP